MNRKKIIVLLKYYKGELNPFDGSALEAALRIGGSVTVIAMAPPDVKSEMENLTRLGVRAILISDRLYAGSDTMATSYILSEALKRTEYDWIFCGRQSMDGDTGQVPVMLAERLKTEFIGRVMQTDGETFFDRDGTGFVPRGKAVFTFEKSYTLRFPSIFSRAGEVEVQNNGVLGLSESECGLRGSPTRVVASRTSTIGRRHCNFVSSDRLTSLIEEGLKKSVVESVKEEQTEKLPSCGYVGDLEKLAGRLAVNPVRLLADTPEALAREITEKKLTAVLWQGTEELKEKASRVAVLLGAGLCADCIDFRIQDGKLIMTRPACGGNVIADITVNGTVAMATVKTKGKSADVVFCVGRGGTAVLDKAREWAKQFGGEVCCSRVVADGGIVPYEGQVGLTGRIVNPKVYVAIGVSGAVQHTCGMEGSGTVIAINEDKDARIFEYADYGIVTDVRDL